MDGRCLLFLVSVCVCLFVCSCLFSLFLFGVPCCCVCLPFVPICPHPPSPIPYSVVFFRYEAIEKHLNHGAWKIEVDMNVGNGKVRSHFISSLSAFWPALQVLAGDVKKAQAGHGTFYSIWKKYSAMPEIFDMGKQKLIQFGKDWPLRPELLESSYHLYVATRDPYYLSVAEDIMNTLNKTENI